jgi:hypothetical protein
MNFEDLVGKVAVSFAMYRHCCFTAWSLYEAENPACFFVIPITEILDPILF